MSGLSRQQRQLLNFVGNWPIAHYKCNKHFSQKRMLKLKQQEENFS